MPTSDSPGRATARARRLFALALTALATLLLSSALASPASATVFPVTSAADSGPGSLRAAIEAANANGGPDSIPIGFSGTIELATALPTIGGETAISGPGPGLTVQPAGMTSFRVFDVGPAPVSISGMTISRGVARLGGGIKSLGPLTLTRVTLSGNEAFAGPGEVSRAEGGAIFTEASLILREVTVTGNTARAVEGNLTTETFGGGVMIRGEGQALVERSTISKNVVESSSAKGILIASLAGVDAEIGTVDRSTISGNSARIGGGATESQSIGGGVSAAFITGSTITGNSVAATAKFAAGANVSGNAGTVVRDTIVSNPQGAPSCFEPMTSGGFNIEDGSGCGFAKPTDLANTNPGLDPVLRDNGGPTPTHALLPGSPAIDRGNAFGATVDQRGLARPSDFPALANAAGGDGSDVGAFELQAPMPPAAPAADTVAPQTRIDRGPPHLTGRPLSVFRFSSSEPGSRFECRLDRGRFKPCRSPLRRRVGAGARHRLSVRAIDAAGNADPTPARYAWRVWRPGRATGSGHQRPHAWAPPTDR